MSSRVRYQGGGHERPEKPSALQPTRNLEIVPLDEGAFGLPTPCFARVTMGILTILLLLLTWRVADHLVVGYHFAITGDGLELKGGTGVEGSAAITVAAKLVFISSFLLLLISLIAHRSTRVHVRLTPSGVAIAVSALLIWQLGAALLVYWVNTRHILSSEALLAATAAACAGFLALASGARLFFFARQHMALSADDVLSSDPRRAILYLRSFASDDNRAPGEPDQPSHMFRPSDRVILPGFWLNRRHLTFEEWFCKALQRNAPVIAIGKPGEGLPRLGAARKYVPNCLWQEEVLRLYEVTQFTCLLLGASEGLRWELKVVLSQENPTKTLLLFPPNDGLQRAWKDFTERFYGLGSDTELPDSLPADALALAFGRNWRPILLTGHQSERNYGKLATLMLRHARGSESEIQSAGTV